VVGDEPMQTIYLGPGEERELIFDNLKQPLLTIAKLDADTNDITVLVWKLDRFARNRYDSAHYKSILKKNGVRVVSATEHITEGPEGIILESMLEGMAEYYSAELAEKIRRGQKDNALKCHNNGGPPHLGTQPDRPRRPSR
jgi:DNA invertase Pin-like site-specific DNA recombinase